MHDFPHVGGGAPCVLTFLCLTVVVTSAGRHCLVCSVQLSDIGNSWCSSLPNMHGAAWKIVRHSCRDVGGSSPPPHFYPLICRCCGEL